MEINYALGLVTVFVTIAALLPVLWRVLPGTWRFVSPIVCVAVICYAFHLGWPLIWYWQPVDGSVGDSSIIAILAYVLAMLMGARMAAECPFF